MPHLPRIACLLACLPLVLATAPSATTPPTTSAATPATTRNVIPPARPVTGKLAAPIPLFNGKDLSGWSWHSGTAGTKIDDAWSVQDGILRLASKPTGFIDTAKEYKNFILTIEQRHLPGATTRDNGGIYICIHGPENQWPDALQIQGKFGAVGDLINQNSGMKSMTTDPARTATVNQDVVVTKINKEAEKPAGQWDTLIITMHNGNLSVTVNGILQNTASDISPDEGKIGLQSEGFPMEFRKIELVPIE
jgi:hypothetical protein